jgi:hypothetical protein
MKPNTIFQYPGGEVSGQDIENVLRTLMVNKDAATYALEKVDMDHRAHQQSFMRLFVYPLLRGWAARFTTKAYDARNQATVVFAAKALADPNDQTCFPYI